MDGASCSVDGTCLQDLKQDSPIFAALHHASSLNEDGVMDTSIVSDEHGEEHKAMVRLIQERPENLNVVRPSLLVSDAPSGIKSIGRQWSGATRNFEKLGNISNDWHTYSDAHFQADVLDSINVHGNDGKVGSPHLARISLVTMEGVVGNVVSVPQGANYSACRLGELPRTSTLCDPGATAFGCDTIPLPCL